MILVGALVCFHCQQEVAGSPFEVAFQTATEDVTLPLCRSCQSLRQGGQLPVEMLLQQWVYSRGGREDAGTTFRQVHVRLACLGCASALAALWGVNEGMASLVFAHPRRLPDGSVTVQCTQCQRTNLLEGRNGQLIAVRLW